MAIKSSNDLHPGHPISREGREASDRGAASPFARAAPRRMSGSRGEDGLLGLLVSFLEIDTGDLDFRSIGVRRCDGDELAIVVPDLRC